MLSRFIHYLHWALLLFILTAWAAPWRDLLLFHWLFVTGVIFHWKTNNDRCFLTELEQKFKKQEDPFANAETPVAEGQFVRQVWSLFFGRELSESRLRATIYMIMALVWCLSAIQLFAGFSFFSY